MINYQKAYELTNKICRFFGLDFDGRKKAQLAQMIIDFMKEIVDKKDIS